MVAKRILVFGILTAASLDLAACESTPRNKSTADQNPFASAQRVKPTESSWSGRVVERLDAGSYVYLRIEREGAQPAWVVTAEAIATDAERVQVRALRRVDHFESKRLSRAFAPLFFGIVRRDNP